MGSRSSSSPVNTSSAYNDSRQVYDAGGGILGDGNTWDTSTTWTQNTADNRTNNNSGNTNWTQSTADNRTNSNSGNTTWNSDSSNRSTTNWDASNRSNTTWTSDSSNRSNTTWNSDSSNRSTTNWDASNRSTNNYTSTDGGAFALVTESGKAQTQMAGQLAKLAFDASGSATAAATKAQADAIGLVGSQYGEIAKLTGSLLTAAQKQSDSAAGSVAAAYSSAASQSNGNKTLTIAAMAAVGLVAAMVVLKKV